jgi:DNA gyrase subunit A
MVPKKSNRKSNRKSGRGKKRDHQKADKDLTSKGFTSIQISDEMEQSYLDYSMSVIVSRALPDVRDGLKPVHRRILYAMEQLRLGHSAKFRKSATIVGEVLGKYHPHGDVAVYDSLVRLAQDFAMRYPLINGHGNFGSIDGDSPAAMRYTESKMEKISSEMLKDIKMDTVDFIDNYDGTVKEPSVLPARIPNILLNGSLGIAVGMATNIPPHNLGELVDALIALLEDPKLETAGLMKYVQGPDFPTGASIYGQAGIKRAYSTGRGKIVVRGKTKIEADKRGKYKIIITEIPFQVNKAELIKKIAVLVKTGRVKGISDLRDESDREGMRIVIELKQSAYPKKVLNVLFKYSRLQDSFYVNMLALVDGIQPRVLGLKDILNYFLKHRREVIRRRSQFELKLIKARLHILEGLRIALAEIDEVIATIKRSKNRLDAAQKLVQKFKLTPRQSEAILDMRLSQLSALEREEIEKEYRAKQARKKELEALLADESKVKAEVKKELEEVAEKFRDDRRTKIFKTDIDQISEEDLVPDKPVIVTLTRDSYIKHLPIGTYKSQGRGGKGVIGMATKEEDVVEQMLVTNTHNNLLFFTDKGKVYRAPVYEIPEASRRSKGQAIVNILQIKPGEKVTGIIDSSELAKDAKYLLMATEQGLVKKTKIEEYEKVRQSGLIAIRLKENDCLKWVKPTNGKDNVILVSGKGKSIRFKEEDVRPMARNTQGVKGIELKKNDHLVGMDVIVSHQQRADKIRQVAEKNLETKKGLEKEDARALVEEVGESKRGLASDLLVVTGQGFGKRSRLKDYPLQKRGGRGVKTANIKPKTGPIVQMVIVPPQAKGDLVIVSAQGKVIRISLISAKKMGRATQGVRLMSLNKSDQFASVSLLAKKK